MSAPRRPDGGHAEPGPERAEPGPERAEPGPERAEPASGEVVALHVDSDEVVGHGGFLAVRRVRLRNRRRDGSLSAAYVCDFLHRPYGQDAVVVAIYRACSDRPGRYEVLLRDGLRPALPLGRAPGRAPTPEPAPGLFHRELVAGILESEDQGLEGLMRRAAAECAEEAGIAIEPTALRLLGAGTLPSPGAMVEKFYFVAAEVPPQTQGAPPPGDGSPMEEDARTSWIELSEAIAASVTGELCDAKTELGLRRLADALAGALPAR